MSAFLRALRAETLKMNHTLALLLAFLAPLVVAALEIIVILQQEPGYQPKGDNHWLWLTQQSLVLWSLLMLPLFITLQTALIAQLEHANKTWKQLYALPLPRWSVIVAKQLSGVALIALSTLVLVALIGLDGLMLRVLRPTFEFWRPVPWLDILKFAGVSFLASWLILSIHSWISLRWPSFVVASAVGIVATIAGVMVANSDYAVFYPWTLPGVLSVEWLQGQALNVRMLLVGSLGGLAGFLLAALDLARQDVLS